MFFWVCEEAERSLDCFAFLVCRFDVESVSAATGDVDARGVRRSHRLGVLLFCNM